MENRSQSKVNRQEKKSRETRLKKLLLKDCKYVTFTKKVMQKPSRRAYKKEIDNTHGKGQNEIT